MWGHEKLQHGTPLWVRSRLLKAPLSEPACKFSGMEILQYEKQLESAAHTNAWMSAQEHKRQKYAKYMAALNEEPSGLSCINLVAISCFLFTCSVCILYFSPCPHWNYFTLTSAVFFSFSSHAIPTFLQVAQPPPTGTSPLTAWVTFLTNQRKIR